MADENVYTNQPVEGERVGFCQECGRPLTAATIRNVGSAVFCEPCLERRIGQTTPGSTPPPPPYSGPTAAPGSFGSQYPPPDGVFPPLDGSTPHPVLAGFLGLIPGVGAMYNGQFAKGFVHLIVFAVLVTLADNVNGVFGLLVAGWIGFMCFEAYHTAKARRLGQPLPDPFGLNNIGERMGFKSWSGPAYPGVNPQPPMSQGNPNWVGYVPPSNFAGTPPSPGPAAYGAPYVADIPVPPPPVSAASPSGYSEGAAASAGPQPSYGYPSYAPIYTGVQASVPPVSGRRFPVAAVWLLALGVLFLPGTISPSLRVSLHWLVPILLAGWAVWLLVRRLGWAGGFRAPGNIVCNLRAPALLMTVAVILGLQAAHALTIGQTWPLFLIVLGALLLIERTAGNPSYTATTPMSPVPDPDAAKGGQ